MARLSSPFPESFFRTLACNRPKSRAHWRHWTRTSSFSADHRFRSEFSFIHLWVRQIKIGKSFDNCRHDYDTGKPFVVRRHDIPWRVFRRRFLNHFFVRLHVIVPKVALIGVIGRELPVFQRIIDSDRSFPSSTFGYARSRSARASITAATTTTRVNHLLSAGTTYHGASFVAVS